MRLEHMHRRDAYTGRQKVQSDNPIGVIHSGGFLTMDIFPQTTLGIRYLQNHAKNLSTT